MLLFSSHSYSSHAASGMRKRAKRCSQGDFFTFADMNLKSIVSGEGVRHLRGCYVNIDEFANRFNLLRRKYVPGAGGASSADPPLPLGNQDWALGRSVGLPDAPCDCGL